MMVRRLSSCSLLMMDDDGTAISCCCHLKDTYRCSSSSSSSSSASSSSSSSSSAPSLPIFLPLITALEIGFFFYFLTNYSTDSAADSTTMTTTMTTMKRRNGFVHLAAAAGSCFVYRPDRRDEVWRFALYMFVHAGWLHLVFNVVVQLLVGVPLEMKHGPIRIATIYMSGVLAGSLATSMFDSEAFLVGASGAVYALIAAHLANIILNYAEMDLALLKLAAICTIAIADVGFTVWDWRSSDSTGDTAALDPLATTSTNSPPVSYVTHFVGAMSGLLVGIIVLRRPKQQKPRPWILWWTSLCVTVASFSFAVLWNLFAL